MLVERISKNDCENGFLLDGFPRNLDQAKALEEAEVEINLILFLKISEKEIIERMSGRKSSIYLRADHTMLCTTHQKSKEKMI